MLQITCRDRNRIALACDLLGAAAQGVSNLLILHGDDPAVGDQPEAMPVYDLDSRAVMSLARQMRDQAMLPSERRIEAPPHFFIGAADTPRFVDQTLGILVAALKSGLPDRLVQLALFFVRSQMANARIKSIDTSRAKAMPGVVAVITGEDIKDRVAPLPQPVVVLNVAGAGSAVGPVRRTTSAPRAQAASAIR